MVSGAFARPLRWPAASGEIRAATLAAASGAAIYPVGGVVRDAWLGRPGQDWDLATSGGARRIARRVADTLGGAYYPLDDSRDVGRVLLGEGAARQTIDIAALRGGVGSDPIERLYADLRDRDFTINAMAVDWRGDDQELIDPLGGAADLAARRLRLCRADALVTDPLRALRGVRLAAQFKLRLFTETTRAIRQAAPQLDQVSPERTRDEWQKLLSLPAVMAALRAAERLGLLAELLPWAANWAGEAEEGGRSGWDARLDILERLRAIHAVIDARRNDEATASFALGMLTVQFGGLRANLQAALAEKTGGTAALRALAALLAGVPAADLRIWGTRWRYSGAEIQWLLSVTAMAPSYAECLRSGTRWELCAHRFWRAREASGVERALLELALAIPSGQFDQDAWLVLLERQHLLLTAYFEEYERLVAPAPLVDGHALMAAMGLPPGPRVGELLDALREAQVIGEIEDVAGALALARRLAEQ